MFRILRRDLEAQRVVLVLQGHIVAEWADVLERECLDLVRSRLSVVLDLSGVTLIGLYGLDVLGRLARTGVGIIGCSPLIADILEEEGIEVSRNAGHTNNRGGSAGA